MSGRSIPVSPARTRTLARKPEFRPDLIIWIPVLIAVTLGSYLIERTN